MHKTIPFLPCRWLLAVLLCDGEVRTLPSGAEGQGRAPSWGPHMAGRASCGWTNGAQRPEGWSGRTTRTPIGDVETGPRVGRWTREEGQRGTGQAGSEEDPMHTQSNTHTWEHSTKGHMFTSVQLFSVAQSCLTLCDPMDCSTPGFPVLHQLQELAQTPVRRVSDAIQLSPILSSVVPFSSYLQSFPASGTVPMGRLFASGSQSIGALCTHGVCVYKVLLKHCHSELPWWSSS